MLLVEIRNLKDLEKVLSKAQPKNIKLSNGQNLYQLLEEEGKRLYKLVKKYIDKYYSSYHPNVYERTYRFKQSLRISPVKLENNSLAVEVYFDDAYAYHPSVLGGKDGYVPLLINDGWRWKDISKAPYRFSHYEGFNFVERAIEEYNKTNPHGLKIKVIKRDYKGERTVEY